MTDHFHDLDLIAGLADGSLDGDPSAAERLLETCPACRAEHEGQQAVRTWLRAAPLVSLTAAERDDLSRRVNAELDRGATIVPLSRRWMALGSVAAALVVAVGVMGVVRSLSSGDDVTATFETASAVTTTGRESVDLAADGAATTAAGSTAATGAGVPLDATAAEVMAVDLGAVDRSEVIVAADQMLASLAASDLSLTRLGAAEFTEAERATPTCLPPEDLFGVITATVDGTDIEVFIVADSETGELRSDAFRVEDCAGFDL